MGFFSNCTNNKSKILFGKIHIFYLFFGKVVDEMPKI
jgi:hypothetical protein